MSPRRRDAVGMLGVAGLAAAAAAGAIAAGPAAAPAQVPTTPTTPTTATTSPTTPTTTPAPTATTPPPTTTVPPAPTPAPPAVSTGGASAITSTGATVAASVDPNGARTTVSFDYGTSSAYGASSAPVDAGDSDSVQAVSDGIGPLRAATTYHVRARASSAAGTTLGADQTFRTPVAPTSRPPGLSGSAVSSTSDTGAVLRTRVDPRGRPTSVVVQYGPTTALGAQTQPVDAGVRATPLVLSVGGLRAGTTYRARIVATSSGGTTRSGLLRLVTRIPTSITATVSPARITSGQTAIVSGKLTGALTGPVAVGLDRATPPFTTFAPLSPGATADGAGLFRAVVRPTQRTRYRVSVGPPSSVTAVSATTRSVLVQPRVGLSAARRADGRVRLTGRIVPRGSARVSLRRVGPGGRLVVVAGTDARPAGTASSYRLTRRLRAGRYLVRVLPSPARGLVSGTSRTIALPAPRRR